MNRDIEWARKVNRQNEWMVPLLCFAAGIPAGMVIAVLLMA